MPAENLDCFVSPDELDPIITGSAYSLRQKRYAVAKARAMRCRLLGKINEALFHERDCDRIYDTLPADERW